jgi:hypothetical protein
MRTVLCSLGLALAACSRAPASGGPPPTDVWGATDYTSHGLPDPGRTWTEAERTQAFVTIQQLTAANPERLPQFHGAKSGAIFDRLVEAPAADDPASPVEDRFARHLTRARLLASAGDLYRPTEDKGPPPREAIELAGKALGELGAALALLDQIRAIAPAARTASRGEDLEGLPMTAATRVMALLEIADQVRLPVEDRRALVGYIAVALPAIFPRVPADQQQLIRETLAKQVEVIEDNRDDFAAALRAIH